MNTNSVQDLVPELFCYLTTTGRVSGQPHTIEIWFFLQNTTIYMLSGGQERADWVKNMRKHPQVSIRIQDRVLTGLAREVRDAEEDALARRSVFNKYTGADEDLRVWAATAHPMAIDLVL